MQQPKLEEESNDLEVIIPKMLSKELFHVTLEDESAMWHGTFDYPNFNDKLLKDILFKMGTADKGLILRGTHNEGGWKIEWSVSYYTSPIQVKIPFQRHFSDYPLLLFEFVAEKPLENYISMPRGGQRITLGQCRSLIKHYDFEWV